MSSKKYIQNALLLSPLWIAVALLLAFLLGLSFIDTSQTICDGLDCDIGLIHPSLSPSVSSSSPSLAKRRRWKRRRRNRCKSKARYLCCRWKRLPFGMAIRCRCRNEKIGLHPRPYMTLKPWRVKRNLKARLRASKHQLESYITPSTVKPTPHYSAFGIVPDDALDAFCDGKGDDFLHLPRLMKRLNSNDHGQRLEKLMSRLNICRNAFELEPSTKPLETATFTGCPLVWDTGASFGLTPFRADFINYIECHIPVKDISKTNYVVGIETTLHKFTSNDV